MLEPARATVRWLTEFERDPATALDALLRGVADVAPYERAEATDVLLMLFGGLAEDDPQRQALDTAMSEWLTGRRRDGPEVRHEYGMRHYIEELIEGLGAVYRLPLPATAATLRRELPYFLLWLQSLYLGPGWDPAGELWRAVALTQRDRSLIEDWYRLCAEAGHTLPGDYVEIGLLGLQHLPEEQTSAPAGTLEPEVLAGLFRWAARLGPGPANRRTFQRRLGALLALYPRAPARWRELALPLLDLYPGAPFRDWLAGAGLKPGRGRKARREALPALPPRSRRTKLLGRLSKEPAGRLLPEIWSLVRDHERYAEATGEVEFLVKEACHLAGRLRRLAPRDALRLARLAQRWEPSNPYVWSQWAEALEAMGEADKAESLFWEGVRRFPENDVIRNALADLLAKEGRRNEAESLLRDTMQRFPDDEVSRNTLSNLLANDARREEAESLLRETMQRFPDDPYSRNALADLVAKDGRKEEAESLLRETMRRFPVDLVAPQSLAFWLLRWERTDEAHGLYWEIRARFPEDRYTRKLAEEIARRQEGWRGEIEVPDFSAWESMDRPDKRVSSENDLGPFFAEDEDDRRSERPSDGAGERLADADTVAEAESEYGDPHAEEPSSDLEIPSYLLSNAVVSRADLRLRSGRNGAVRKEALAAIEEILAADPERVYPRLVLDLHDRERHRQLAAEAEAFPHAYPLRFLAARVADTAESWNRLLSDFGEHRPMTLLGRLVAGNGAVNPADAARLAAWVEEQNGSRRGFEAYTADRLRGWLGDAPAEAEAGELLRRLTRHREGIEMLVGDALRRAADPEMIYTA